MPRSLARALLRLRWRPRFSVALVALVVVLTAFTGATIGWLAWREQRAQSRALADAAMTQAARLVATHTARFLRGAEGSARLGPRLVAEKRLDPADFDAARIQAIAFGGEALLSASVVERVRGAVRVGVPRRVRAKGFAGLVTIYPLEGLQRGAPLATEPPELVAEAAAAWPIPPPATIAS